MDSVLPGCSTRMSTTARPHSIGYSTTYRLNDALQDLMLNTQELLLEVDLLCLVFGAYAAVLISQEVVSTNWLSFFFFFF